MVTSPSPSLTLTTIVLTIGAWTACKETMEELCETGIVAQARVRRILARRGKDGPSAAVGELEDLVRDGLKGTLVWM